MMYPLPLLTDRVSHGHELSAPEVAAAAEILADGAAEENSKSGFLTALAQRGETAAELAEFARAFRARAVDPGVAEFSSTAIDIVGTGGDHSGGFNISTIVVLVLASGGVTVMKHGNRGVTSKCGSADLIAGLGFDLHASAKKKREALSTLGYIFYFAPDYHPAFKNIGPVRRDLAARGQRTIFNLLGPLLNPGKPAHLLAGVFSEEWVPRLADAAAQLGLTAGIVAHGKISATAGIDEFTTATRNRVRGLGKLASLDDTWTAETVGLPPANFDDLKGGDLAENLRLVEEIVAGRGRPGLVDTILANAALGFWIMGRAASATAGVSLAREHLLGGGVQRKISETRAFFSS